MNDGEKTLSARRALLPISTEEYEEQLLEDIKYAKELEAHNYILEGVVECLGKLGIACDESDSKSVIKSLKKLYKEAGISEDTPDPVKNWISKGILANPDFRKNLYDLCIALKLNEIETQEFFLKHFLTIPYNYKNTTDVIYYFGIKQGLPYNDILGLLREFEEECPVRNEKCEKTEEIGNAIWEISDIGVFREYLRRHRYSKQQQFCTVSKKINEFLNANAIYAEKERKLRPELLSRRTCSVNMNHLEEISIVREKGDVNIKALLFVINGGVELHGYSCEDEDISETHSISKSATMPKLFRKNFPREQEFSRKKKKNASADVYRKALIILYFYFFFSELLFSDDERNEKAIGSIRLDVLECRTDKKREADFEDFIQQTSAILAECGYVQLYARNPFDWLIMYCARSYNPIQTYRELLSKASEE